MTDKTEGGHGEIDREVAEKVMGWLFDKGPFTVPQYLNDDGETTHEAADWSPSTRIDHAWEVLDKISMKEWFMQMNFYRFNGDPHEPWVIELVGDNGLPFVESSGETAPMAICKAALEAVKAGGET